MHQTSNATKTFDSDSQYRFIVGGVGQLKTFRLSMQNLDEFEEEWMVKLPSDSTMVNAITMAGENKIVAGCGDSNIYTFDRETGQQTAIFCQHNDYIHSLKCSDQNSSNPLLYSCGEDGKIFCWDYRSSNKPSLSLEPFRNPELRRIQYGKWIGSIDVTDNNEWIVCGGGPKLSLWHLRSAK
ncbi:THO complex subunit 6-like protein, partial [Euroglyphus maynei]